MHWVMDNVAGLATVRNWFPEAWPELLRVRLLVIVLLCATVFVGCDQEQRTARTADAPTLHGRVAVTNYPLYCMVRKICVSEKDLIKEVVYVGPAAESDPHSWIPSADQIRDLQNVDLIVCNGPGAVFANWMDKVTIDESKLCKTTDAIKLTEFVLVKDYQLVHSHGPEGEHSHNWVVPQSWLSPRIARKQAKHCFDRLVKVYGQSSKLDDGFAELQKQFDELEAAHENVKARSPDLIVASSTPEIQYLTRSLGWSDRYLQWTEARDFEQAEKELTALRTRNAKPESNKVTTEKMFLWSGDAIKPLADFVASNWSQVVVVDLIDRPGSSTDSDDYFNRMAENFRRLDAAIE